MRLIYKDQVRSSREAAELLRSVLKGCDPMDVRKEQFWVVTLDARCIVMSVHMVSMGDLTEVIVHPREVFRPAVHEGAFAIIVGHNHPNGDVEPSDTDRKLHWRLCEAGKILGIPVVDHIVVTSEEWYSLMEKGGQYS